MPIHYSCACVAILGDTGTVSQSGREKRRPGALSPVLENWFPRAHRFFLPTRPTASGSPGEDEVNRECLLLSLVPVVLCGLCGWDYTDNVY